MTGDSFSSQQVKTFLTRDAARVRLLLESIYQGRNLPQGLREAMEYSLLSGGKRIRPVLCLTSARLFGLSTEQALPFAGALECIHTYSLIHDDLPAMDDDDLRRGRPSSHKAFGEATAILAGDGLLTDAFGLMTGCAELGVPAENVLRAVALAAEAAGSVGMVGGQYLDMLFTARPDVSIEQVADMQAGKTGAMLRLACEAGAVLAGADEAGLAAMRAYGAAFGAAFQITDDILDETGNEAELGKAVGRDAALAKNTYPALLGLEASRARAMEHIQTARQSLQAFSGDEAAMLRGLAGYLANRVR